MRSLRDRVIKIRRDVVRRSVMIRTIYRAPSLLLATLLGACTTQAEPPRAEKLEPRSGSGDSTSAGGPADSGGESGTGTSTGSSAGGGADTGTTGTSTGAADESTGDSGGSSSGTTGGFVCDNQPEGWPATKDEIVEAFSSSKFKIRQCASTRLADRVCDGDLVEILRELADPANGYDPEVRGRAQQLLGNGAPAVPTVGEIEMDGDDTLLIGDPPGWIPGENWLPGQTPAPGESFSDCEIRVWDYLGGDPAEAVFQDTYGPESTDDCGNGSGGYELDVSGLPCPAEKLEVEVICFNSLGESATETFELPEHPDCEEGDTGTTTGGDTTGGGGESTGTSSGGTTSGYPGGSGSSDSTSTGYGTG